MGTSGHAGTHNSVSAGAGTAEGVATTESKVGGMPQGSTSGSRPGAGSSVMKPSQGSGKVGQ